MVPERLNLHEYRDIEQLVILASSAAPAPHTTVHHPDPGPAFLVLCASPTFLPKRMAVAQAQVLQPSQLRQRAHALRIVAYGGAARQPQHPEAAAEGGERSQVLGVVGGGVGNRQNKSSSCESQLLPVLLRDCWKGGVRWRLQR